VTAAESEGPPAAHASADADAPLHSANLRRTLLLSGLPMLVVAILGAFRLGARPLSLDETTSYYLTQIGWGRFFEVVLDSKVNMSLYFSLLRLWPFTGDEAGMRALSIVFGILTVPPLIALARRIMPDLHAVAAAIVLAATSLYLYEVRDARGYSLVVFLVVLGTWLLVVAVESRRAWPWVAWGAAMGLGLFAHFFAAFVLLAHLVAIAWTRPAFPRGPAIVAGAVLVLAAVPMGLTVLLTGGTTLTWVQPTTWERLWASLVAFAGSGATLGIYAVGLVLGLAALTRWPADWGERSPLAWRVVLLSALLPVLIIVLLSLLKPVLVDRYLIVALPFVVLAAVGALVATSKRLGAAALAILLVVCAVTTSNDLRATPGNPPAWVARVIDGAAPGDGVVFAEAQYRKVLAYYLPEVLVGTLALATSDVPIDANPYELRQATGVSFDDALQRMPCRHERVWLIGGPANLERAQGSTLQSIVAALRDSYAETAANRFGNRLVRLWERDASVGCA
jgi:mannosyltransferase